MIPWLAIVRIRGRKRGMPFTLWIPLFLLWLLLAPLVLLLAPFAFLACLVTRVPVIQAGTVCWQILVALRGLHIEIREPDGLVKIVIC